MKVLVWAIALGIFFAATYRVDAQFASPYSGEEANSGRQDGRGFSGTATETATESAPAQGIAVPALGRHNSYKLGPLDVVQVSVYGVPELSVTAPITADGYLQLPLLGATQASGRTAEQLQREITERLAADYLQNPQVIVLVKEYNSRSVVVTGAIKNGVYPLKGRTTLLQLVAGAGGFEDNSDSTVVILRQSGGKQTAAKFDVSEIEKGRAPDVTLQAGDRIVAGESMFKNLYGAGMKALGIAGRFAIF